MQKEFVACIVSRVQKYENLMNEIAVHKNLIIANSTYRRWHDVKLEFAMEFTEFVTPEEEYRSRKLKSRQDAAEEAVDELKDKIFNISLYLALVAQRNLLKPPRVQLLRGLIIELMSDYFKYGATPEQDPVLFEKQKSFLQFHISKDFKINLPGAQSGYQPLLQQYMMATVIHDGYEMQKELVACIDSTSETYMLIEEGSFIVSHRTILGLYPHMLDHPEFMKKALGQTLRCRITTFIRFDENNKIISIYMNRPIAEAWCNLLRDPVLTCKVLAESKVNVHGYIITAEHENLIRNIT